MQLPIQLPPGLAELIEELIDQDPRAVRLKCRVPHPLSNFAGPNFVDGLFADIVLDFIHDTVWGNPSLTRTKGRSGFCWKANRRITLRAPKPGSTPADCGVICGSICRTSCGDAQVSQAKDGRGFDVAWRGSVSSHSA